MNLKHTYIISVIGIIMSAFGGGWLALAFYIDARLLHHGFGAVMLVFGLAIVIATLSTIKKIDVVIEDFKEPEPEKIEPVHLNPEEKKDVD